MVDLRIPSHNSCRSLNYEISKTWYKSSNFTYVINNNLLDIYTLQGGDNNTYG